MYFLLFAILALWSVCACFLPVREKLLRSMVMGNVILLVCALFALVIPVFHGEPVTLFGGLFFVDTLRALLSIPLGLSWMVCMGTFILWWGESFKTGSAARPLFCLRSATLIFGFFGIVTALTAGAPIIMLGGILLMLCATCIGALFHVKENALQPIRKFVLGCLAAIVMFLGGAGLFIWSEFQQAGRLLLTPTTLQQTTASSVSTLELLAIATMGFAILWLLGLIPGMTWYRRGLGSFPKGHRLMLRVFMPLALFPQFLALAHWGGNAGELFMQKMLLVFAFFAGITTLEYLRVREGLAETSTVFLLAVIFVTMAYGPAGVIPAVMLVMMMVMWGAILLISRGATAWGARQRTFASAIIAGIPVVSPFFIPFSLSIGYGIQMMPIAACIAAMFMIGTLYVLVGRIMHAWTENQTTPTDMWGGRLGVGLLVGMSVYGCWFLYADALALIVKSVGI